MEEEDLDRKRSAVEKTPPSTPKRQRQCPAAADEDRTDVTSVSSLLTVPLDYVFRTVPQNSTTASISQQQRAKPLLTRAEAQCFLSVGALAVELDSLFRVATQALENRSKYTALAAKVEATPNPQLRALVAMLHTMGQVLPQQTLVRTQSELASVLEELRMAALQLKQFSEQNWTLSETLWDVSSGEEMAKEKRRLSDIQDELYQRIEKVLNKNEEELSSMEEYCKRALEQSLFSPMSSQSSRPSQEEEETKKASEEYVQQEEEQPSQDDDDDDMPSQEEKENSAPSQPVVFQEMNNGSESQHSIGIGQPTQNAAEALNLLASSTTPFEKGQASSSSQHSPMMDSE